MIPETQKLSPEEVLDNHKELLIHLNLPQVSCVQYLETAF